MNFLFILFSISIASCFYENIEMDECDNTKGRFINGRHFVPGSFLNEEKKWSYTSWHKEIKFKKKNNCIPIPSKMTLEEIIDEEDGIVDLKR